MIKMPPQGLKIPNQPITIGYLGVAASSAGVLTETRVNANETTMGGWLTAIRFKTNASGSIKVKFWTKRDETYYDYFTEFEVSVTSGDRYYPVTKTYIPKGSIIGVYTTDALNAYYNSTGNSINLTGNVVTGISKYFARTYSIAIGAILEYVVAEEIQSINNDIGEIDVTHRKITNEIFYEKFIDALPTHFTNTGNFVKNTGYLSSPASVGYAAQFYYNKPTSLDAVKVFADIKLTDIASIVGIGTNPQSTTAGGMFGEVDFANKKIILRRAWNFTGTPLLSAEKAFTFDPVLNRVYKIELEKVYPCNATLKITDTCTNDTESLNSSYLMGDGWGGGCIVAVSGAFDIMSFSHVNNQPRNPILAIYGDSFVEGETVGGSSDKYAAKIKTALSGDCLIAGKGGDRTSHLLARLESDFYNFSPKYTLLGFGANDSLADTAILYQSNMALLIDYIESLGSEVILVTIPRTASPSADNLTWIQTINPWIRSLGYKYIDFAVALSDGYDGITQNTALFLSDGIHPNVDGHTVMYNRALIDIPEIFCEQ